MTIARTALAPRSSNRLPPAWSSLKLGKSLGVAFLSMACCFASTAAVAQAQLRAHWIQEIEEQPVFVGVLSRSEDEDVRYVDLHLEVFSEGVPLGSEVHRVEFDESVKLFSLPVEEGIDCLEVTSVIGIDSVGREVRSEEASPPSDESCSSNNPRYFETARLALSL